MILLSMKGLSLQDLRYYLEKKKRKEKMIQLSMKGLSLQDLRVTIGCYAITLTV